MKTYRKRLAAAASALGLLAILTGQPMAHAQNPPSPIVVAVEKSGIDTTKPFVLVVQFQAKHGEGPALEKAFAPAIAATRKEKGCLQYDLSRDPTAPESYLLYERWTDLESLKAHLVSEHIATMQKALEGVRAAPPQARVLAPVGNP